MGGGGGRREGGRKTPEQTAGSSGPGRSSPQPPPPSLFLQAGPLVGVLFQDAKRPGTLRYYGASAVDARDIQWRRPARRSAYPPEAARRRRGQPLASKAPHPLRRAEGGGQRRMRGETGCGLGRRWRRRRRRGERKAPSGGGDRVVGHGGRKGPAGGALGGAGGEQERGRRVGMDGQQHGSEVGRWRG